MKYFIALLLTETNTFSPIPTGMDEFRQFGLWHGNASSRDTLFGPVLARWRQSASAAGHDVVESLGAVALPGGPVEMPVYEAFKREILSDLKRAMPVDVVLLQLHGAMIATECDDCEGDLIKEIRQLVGAGTVIGAELDLHCLLSQTMLENSDLLISYKEYPHTDIMECGDRLFDLCTDIAEGKLKPAGSVHDCRMISTWKTTEQPMSRFVGKLRDLEETDGIISISFCHGFPWGDSVHNGAKMLVYANADSSLAARTAVELGTEIWMMRHETHPEYPGVDEALDLAEASGRRPIVLADTADNPGGGAPADATFILERILARKIDNVVSGVYCDPESLAGCRSAGKGAMLDLELGGRTGNVSGKPVALKVAVRALVEDYSQPDTGGGRQPVGSLAWVSLLDADLANVNLVISEHRCQTLHPQIFTVLGIDLLEMKLVVVKSSQHFHAGFAPLAGDVIYVTSPGALNFDFAGIPYRKFVQPYWPRHENPPGMNENSNGVIT